MATTVLWRRAFGVVALVAGSLALALSGCSDSSTPPATPGGDQGSELVAGELEPGAQTFVLRRIETPVPGFAPIRVALIGGNLSVDPIMETVSLDVAVRNDGQEPLHAPARIWLSDFVPPAVTVLNADFYPGPPDTNPAVTPPPPPRWGFDYTELLGGDQVLAPGETSEAKTWTFQVPGLTGFSFRARPEFGMVPDLPRIAGRVFLDRNRDGVPQPDEPPFMCGPIHATGPDGFEMTAIPDRSGRYAIPVELPGLYTLTLRVIPPNDRTQPLHDGEDDDDADNRDWTPPSFTTPNPLQVLLAPGPDGRPQSFLEAHFGLFIPTGGGYPPVLPSPVPLDSLGGDHYQYLQGRLRANLLVLGIGYSGCQPEHPLALYFAPGPQMSPLPHFDLVLVHDGLGEMCDAWWERRVAFDLTPLRARPDGSFVLMPITLHLRDFQGVVHDFVWEWDVEDDGAHD